MSIENDLRELSLKAERIKSLKGELDRIFALYRSVNEIFEEEGSAAEKLGERISAQQGFDPASSGGIEGTGA